MAAIMRESVKDTLENLIEQFSDVYCFYRELIQNSLDAGTNRVDVYLEFIPDRDREDHGVMVIHVDDYGEGMNRNIIDNQLTRLFSSTKENDLTKIGKFGIGFVSVFAIKPDAVNIDTSRDGEDWRILFQNKEEFHRLRRDYPVDGTKIQIYKTCEKRFFDIFLQRSRETVILWCKHSEAEIYFQDELVNQPYDVESFCKIHRSEPAGEVVAGYTRDKNPFFGFYNQGLTLVEGNKEFFPGITFKIKSKYLEHTLTRDNIREDENYWKAMDLLNRIVQEDLPAMLFSGIQDELAGNQQETPEYRKLLGYAGDYLSDGSRLPARCRDAKIARTTSGNYMTAGQLMELQREKEILYDYRANPVTEALEKNRRRVVLAREDSALLDLLKKLSSHRDESPRVFRASDRYFIPRLVEVKDHSEDHKKILNVVSGLNRRMKNSTEPIRFAHFDYPDSAIEDRVYVLQEEPGELSPMSELEEGKNLFKSFFSLFSRHRSLILNVKNPYIENLLSLAGVDSELAGYFLAKLLYMDDGIDTATDGALVNISLDRRSL